MTHPDTITLGSRVFRRVSGQSWACNAWFLFRHGNGRWQASCPSRSSEWGDTARAAYRDLLDTMAEAYERQARVLREEADRVATGEGAGA